MSAPISTETRKLCPLCDAPLNERGDGCTRCDWVPGYGQQRKIRNRRNPRDIAAAALSVIPGAGHVFKGYLWPGVALAVATPLVVLLSIALNFFAGWALPLIFWPTIMLDAYFRRDLRPNWTTPPSQRAESSQRGNP